MIKKFKDLDFVILIIVLLLTVFGILFIYSSSQGKGEVYKKQILWAIFSFFVLIIILFINIKALIFYSPILYFISILPLIYLVLFGKRIAGAKSWIDFGYFSIQPAEFVKITTALFLAKVVAENKKDFLNLKNILTLSLIVFIPFFLIFLQPDYGTAFTLLSFLFASIYLGGIRTKTIILLIVLIFIGGLFAWEYILKDYHKLRIVAIFFPELDPYGSSYQLTQSKISLGSGGLKGKGFLKGTQTKGGFLPAPSTDFILSSAGEEFGFVGVFVILSLYLFFFLRILKIIENIEVKSIVVFSFLISFILFFQFVLNVSMILGFFPVIGIPLPFLSYGGSSLLSVFSSVGLILNGRMRGKIEE
ncbi:MAG: FtsW/RodA/SpoVE family cell cycle protein [Candidatus Aminicenantia bacterium]